MTSPLVGHRTSGRRLVVAAFWTNQDPDSAVDHLTEAVRETGLAFKHSGELVAIEERHVDPDLRRWLRAINMPLVAAYPSVAPGHKDQPEELGS